MRIILRTAFIASVIAFAAFSSLMIPLDGPLTNVRVAGAADPIDIDLSSDNGGGFVSFGTDCNTEMAPGDLCTDLLIVRNAASEEGGVDFTYTIAVWIDDNGTDDGATGPAGDSFPACFFLNMHSGPADGLNVGTQNAFGPIAGSALAPGDTEEWGLEVEVVDDNACQGQSGFIIGFVFATEIEQTPTPTPVVTSTPTATPVPPEFTGPTSTPITQTGGVVVTPTSTRTPVQEQAGVVVQNLPRTGSGAAAQSGSSALIAGAGLALLSALLLLANVLFERRDRRGGA